MSKYRVIEETPLEIPEKEEVQEKNTKPVKQDKKAKKVKTGGFKAKANETISELKKVTWPTWVDAIKKTGIVLAFVSIALVLLLLIDLLLSNLVNLL